MAISVVKLMEGWSFETALGVGATGTRTYIDAFAKPNETPEDLPLIGQSWDSTYTLCTLKKIKVEYIANNPNCPQKYICSYDSSPVSVIEFLAQQPSGGNQPPPNAFLPINKDASAQFNTYSNVVNNGGEAWYFRTSDDSAIDESKGDEGLCGSVSVPKREILETFNFKKFVYIPTSAINNYQVDLTSWNNIVWPKLGKVNKEVFFSYPKETLMFTGCRLTEVRSHTNNKCYIADLTFSAKVLYDKDGIFIGGWNHIYDPLTNSYGRIGHCSETAPNSTPLYDLVDFDQNNNSLINGGTPDVIIISSIGMPEN
jgi:hypothetical protein